MINSFPVIPGYTFFYWGFTLPKSLYPEYMRHFRLRRGHQLEDVVLVIDGKKYPAKIRVVYQRDPKYPSRPIVQIYYDRERDTLKALRRLFVYSYAATINKARPDLKEMMEFVPTAASTFRIKVISRHKTDLDDMFLFLEDKNLLEYWKDSKEKRFEDFFIDYARSWLPVSRLREFETRANVIYLLYHSRKHQLYVGKANVMGERVKKGQGRIGLADDWDRFMFFEIHPNYAHLIEQIEAYTIRTYASLMPNKVGAGPLWDRHIMLTNRQLRR